MPEDYLKRLNKVLSFIDKNLDGDLSLEKIARLAYYSPFHLHRLFKAVTNETLNVYVTRKRIERAALLLIHHQEMSLSEIADKFGFKSDSVFSRTFKKIYGQSPRAFRKANASNFSKISKVNSNNGPISFITEAYLYNITHLKNWLNMNAKIEIKEMPTLHLAYLTHIGINNIDQAFQRIIKWATPKGILTQAETNVCRVFHDSFKVTDAQHVRMSIGILSPNHFVADKAVDFCTLEKSKTIVGHFLIEPFAFEKAWNSLFIWMNTNGYQKAEANPFEIYYNNYMEHPDKKCIVDLCIPIQ